MMDPHCRTIFGFQSLVQKEWIMGGHCFLDRCNHLRQSDKEEVSVLGTDLGSLGHTEPYLSFNTCTAHTLGACQEGEDRLLVSECE